MNEEGIIKIKVVESNGDVSYGTAYRISHSHALTALHVLDDVDGQTGFSFYFSGRDKPVPDYTLSYENEEYDIAIITFADDVLASLCKVSVVEIAAADSSMEWDGCGYPKFAEAGDDRALEHIKGGCYNTTSDNPFFQVDCVKQAKIKTWGGVSGAPLFARHNKKLIGIISSVDSAVDNTHFDVSAIWKLLSNKKDSFASFFEAHDIRQKIHQAAQRFLEQDNQLYTALKEQSESARVCIDRLFAKDLPELLGDLKNIKKNVSADIQQRISQFVLTFLPYYFSDQAVVVDESIKRDYEAVIDLDCVSDVAVEFSLASFDGREAYVERMRGNTPYDDWLCIAKGKYALTPEMGIDQDEEDKVAFTQQMLASRALDVVLERFSKGRRRRNPEKQINRHLKQAREDGNSFYLVICLDESQADYQSNLAKVKQYREMYPDLIIVGLSLDDDIGDEEDENLYTLPFIIE